MTITHAIKNLAACTATALAILAGTPSAEAAIQPIDIGGVTVDIGDTFNMGITSLFETRVSAVGDELRGVGLITAITGSTGNVLWSNGQNNRELTFFFDDYIVTSITASNITFSGGKLTVYIQDTTAPSYTAFDASTVATGITTASDGDEWLDLVGHAGAFTSSPTTTLEADVQIGNFLGAFFRGSGFGLLDVDPVGSGIANWFFNQNGLTDGADVLFGSNFNTTSAGASQFQVAGSADFIVNVVPEPTSGILLALGCCMLWRPQRRHAA